VKKTQMKNICRTLFSWIVSLKHLITSRFIQTNPVKENRYKTQNFTRTWDLDKTNASFFNT